MTRHFTLLLLIVLLAGCGTTRSFYQQGSATVESGPVRVPIHLVKETLLVDVQIGGRTYRFLLDTGAPTMISSRIYEEQKLKPKARQKVTDTHGRARKLVFTVLPRMEVGGLVL